MSKGNTKRLLRNAKRRNTRKRNTKQRNQQNLRRKRNGGSGDQDIETLLNTNTKINWKQKITELFPIFNQGLAYKCAILCKLAYTGTLISSVAEIASGNVWGSIANFSKTFTPETINSEIATFGITNFETIKLIEKPDKSQIMFHRETGGEFNRFYITFKGTSNLHDVITDFSLIPTETPKFIEKDRKDQCQSIPNKPSCITTPIIPGADKMCSWVNSGVLSGGYCYDSTLNSLTYLNQYQKNKIYHELPILPELREVNLRDIKVHGGIMNSYNTFRNEIVEFVLSNVKPEEEIIVTGQSLGGAYSILLALDLQLIINNKSAGGIYGHHFPSDRLGDPERWKNKIQLFTFGSPSVGNEEFNTYFHHFVPVFWRFVYENDIVARLNFLQKQLGTLILVGSSDRNKQAQDGLVETNLSIFDHNYNDYIDGIRNGTFDFILYNFGSYLVS